MNEYGSIARYYDLLMDSGYYDHESLARVVQSTLGSRRKVLELGVGTGLLAEKLLQLESDYQLTGVDFSPSMLKIARERLPEQVCLVQCDVAEMHLSEKFDAAISSGGTWVIIRSDDGLLLGTHLPSEEKDVRGLHNVADHLDANAPLLLSIQDPHENRQLDLADGIVYSQTVEPKRPEGDHFFIEKEYSFQRNGKTLAEEKLTLGFYNEAVFPELLADAGFAPRGMTDAEDFFICEKVR